MLGRKLFDFIRKDTGEQNESARVIVIVRFMMLSIAVYCIVCMILCGAVLDGIGSVVIFGILPVLFPGLFALSYRLKKVYILWCFNCGTVLWVCLIVHCLGWNIGVQHFLIVLLVLYFFSDYKHHMGKILFAVSLGVFRILLFCLYHKNVPLWPMSSEAETVIQILSTIAIFWCISVVAFICSKDVQEPEGKLVEYNNQLELQANTDTLTGLYNRRKAMKYMDKIVNHHDIYGDWCLCIADIDFFKKVNDNYGHDYGDEVLRKIAGVFKKEMGQGDFAARWGGEEFLLVFLGCNGDEAFVKLEHIRRKIREMEVPAGDDVIRVTMTFGLAEYNFIHGLDMTIKEADEKLYMGKAGGRDTIVF